MINRMWRSKSADIMTKVSIQAIVLQIYLEKLAC